MGHKQSLQSEVRISRVRDLRRENVVGGIMTPDTLLKTDKCTIAVETAPEGKIRVLKTAWAEPVVILADQVLEVRIRRGQINILRKPRVEEPPTIRQPASKVRRVTRDGRWRRNRHA
jgi:hypothetical protein